MPNFLFMAMNPSTARKRATSSIIKALMKPLTKKENKTTPISL
jgi:hypothetical protein